jgi:hypothetical protein
LLDSPQSWRRRSVRNLGAGKGVFAAAATGLIAGFIEGRKSEKDNESTYAEILMFDIKSVRWFKATVLLALLAVGLGMGAWFLTPLLWGGCIVAGALAALSMTNSDGYRKRYLRLKWIIEHKAPPNVQACSAPTVGEYVTPSWTARVQATGSRTSASCW